MVDGEKEREIGIHYKFVGDISECFPFPPSAAQDRSDI